MRIMDSDTMCCPGGAERGSGIAWPPIPFKRSRHTRDGGMVGIALSVPLDAYTVLSMQSRQSIRGDNGLPGVGTLPAHGSELPPGSTQYRREM